LTLISPGQEIVGVPDALEVTVTEKLQLLPPLEHVTAVLPTGKLDPDGGLHTTGGVTPVSGSAQLPEATGVE
jgi:hypothetical protein